MQSELQYSQFIYNDRTRMESIYYFILLKRRKLQQNIPKQNCITAKDLPPLGHGKQALVLQNEIGNVHIDLNLEM